MLLPCTVILLPGTERDLLLSGLFFAQHSGSGGELLPCGLSLPTPRFGGELYPGSGGELYSGSGEELYPRSGGGQGHQFCADCLLDKHQMNKPYGEMGHRLRACTSLAEDLVPILDNSQSPVTSVPGGFDISDFCGHLHLHAHSPVHIHIYIYVFKYQN